MSNILNYLQIIINPIINLFKKKSKENTPLVFKGGGMGFDKTNEIFVSYYNTLFYNHYSLSINLNEKTNIIKFISKIYNLSNKKNKITLTKINNNPISISYFIAFKDFSLLIYTSKDGINFHFASLNESIIKKIEILYNKTIQNKENEKRYLNFLVKDTNGLFLKSEEIKQPMFSLEENYNDDLIDFHKKVVNSINNDENGIVFLHSDPGNGKTYYIRHLISEIEKDCIYVPPSFSHLISEPSFLSFMLNNKNKVLVIEDAENVIGERRGGDNQSVSNLLNISDGLLGDALNFQIICTFNTGQEDIDDALLRKGRVLAKHEFQPLNKEKSNKLLSKLGRDYTTNESMRLADIYNLEENKYEKEEKTIGFK